MLSSIAPRDGEPTQQRLLNPVHIMAFCTTGAISIGLVCWTLAWLYKTRPGMFGRSIFSSMRDPRSVTPILPMHGLDVELGQEEDEKDSEECVKSQIRRNSFYPAPERKNSCEREEEEPVVIVPPVTPPAPVRAAVSRPLRPTTWAQQATHNNNNNDYQARRTDYLPRLSYHIPPPPRMSPPVASPLQDTPTSLSSFASYITSPTPTTPNMTLPFRPHPYAYASNTNYRRMATPAITLTADGEDGEDTDPDPFASRKPVTILPLRMPPRKVRQMFVPAMPDELGVRVGERMRVVKTFEDGWCLVRRPSGEMREAIQREVFGGGGGSGSDTGGGKIEEADGKGEMEMGVVPAWCFLPPAPGLTPLRRPRHASLDCVEKYGEGSVFSF